MCELVGERASSFDLQLVGFHPDRGTAVSDAADAGWEVGPSEFQVFP